MAWDSSVPILRNEDDDPIPQVWDDDAQAWVAYEGAVEIDTALPTGTNTVGNVNVNDKIDEYMWFDGDGEPNPGASNRAVGIFVNASDEWVIKHWDGTAWGDPA